MRHEDKHWRTFVDVLRDQAQHDGERTAFIFLSDGERAEERLSFGELDRRARAVAHFLRSRVAPDGRVILVIPSGLEYVVAYFGCLYAGIVAVTAHTPRFHGALRDRDLRRLEAIVHDAEPSLVLTTTANRLSAAETFAGFPDLASLPWHAVDEVDIACASLWKEPSLNPEDLAFLQYTSGSTSSPKGVMVTHGNLLHNQQVMQSIYGHSRETRIVSWLPLFHDMGLIGQMLHAVYLGGQDIFLAPEAFVSRPARWLEAISRYRGTSTLAPNFGYELCLRKTTPEERKKLDLSSWQVAGNASEPVRAETMKRFSRLFRSAGFRQSAFFPSYGLAEATLIVTGGPKQGRHWPRISRVQAGPLDQRRFVPAASTDRTARELASSGPACLHDILLVDPQTLRPSGDGQAGEIWISGSSVAAGYWKRSTETESTFHARTIDGDGPFLRTGDLGFVHEGHLYVAGRLKDLIILHGNNFYPQDIEETVDRCHSAVRPGCGAAFSIDCEDEERLVLTYEIQDQLDPAHYDEVFAAIRAAVANEHSLAIHAITLIPARTIWKTTSGKIQRSLCRREFLDGAKSAIVKWHAIDSPLDATDNLQHASDVKATPLQVDQTLIREILGLYLGIEPNDLDAQRPLAEYGLDSAVATSITISLSQRLDREIPPTLLYDYPTTAALVEYLSSLRLTAVPQAPRADERATEIAIVGMSCRFPGAGNIDQFWANLGAGRDSIRDLPTDRWPASDHPRRVKRAGTIDEPASFDASFFQITPHEAQRMDPQQRLVLETCWETLESACLAGGQLRGTNTGVFIGVSQPEYLSRIRAAGSEEPDGLIGPGNYLSMIANRLSYFLDLQGPSLAVDTACSSSLVALHLAVEAIRKGECQTAIVGGVNLLFDPTMFDNFAAAGMLAADGRCKTFDARADGYVRSEGVGFVVLRPLGIAHAEHDTIWAVVRGTAVNQDGTSNGITAPSGPAQEKLLRLAYESTGIAPASIELLECHGTGTSLGDPIEVGALSRFFSQGTKHRQTCALGSVKSNIGHLEAAAGIAGLIKCALALHHRVLPPTLHLEIPNPLLKLDESPFYIVDRSRPWIRGHGPRRVGVSSFGFGGTNAHAILEEAPQTEARSIFGERPNHVLSLSAKGTTQLRALATKFALFLEKAEHPKPADLCYSANTGRPQFAHRLAVTGKSTTELREALQRYLSDSSSSHSATTRSERSSLRIGVLFSTPIPWVTRELFATSLTFRDAARSCALRFGRREAKGIDQRLAATTRPRVPKRDTETLDFISGYALAQLWHSWGIEPATVAGYGVGVILAGHFAGAITLDQAVTLLRRRHANSARTSREKLAFSIPSIPWFGPNGDPIIHLAAIEELLQDLQGSKGETSSYLASGLRTHCDVAIDLAQCTFTEHSDSTRFAKSEHTSVWDLLTDTLAWLYREGAGVDWQGFDAGYHRHRLPLPTYPFEKKRYWFGENLICSHSTQTAPHEVRAAEWFHEIAWIPEPISECRELPRQRWLIFADSLGVGDSLATTLRTNGHETYLVKAAERFERRAPQAFTIAPTSAEDYRTLLSSLPGIDGVIHLWNCAPGSHSRSIEDVNQRIALGTESLFHLHQQLSRLHPGCRNWLVVTTDAQGGETSHEIVPEHAAAWGYVRALANECPEIRYRLTDFRPDLDVNAAADRLWGEMRSASCSAEVLYRSNERWIPILHREQATTSVPMQLRDDGVYLITGGLGSLGLQIAKEIGKEGHRTLVLLSRTPLPPPDVWGTNTQGASSQTAISTIRNLQESGTTVWPVAADVADPHAMATLFADIRQRYGRLDGIIHTAGIIDDGPAATKSLSAFHNVLRAKVEGTWILKTLAEEHEVNFLIGFSAIAATFGTPGQSDYAAGNAYLDAALRGDETSSGLRTMSLSWSAWSEVGMAARTGTDRQLERLGWEAITPAQGRPLFAAALAHPAGNRIVYRPISSNPHAPSPFLRRITDGSTRPTIELAKHLTPEALTHIVSTVTGLSVLEIDANRNFQELGIDSILAMRIAQVIGDATGQAVDVTLLFRLPTIHALAQHFAAASRLTNVSTSRSPEISHGSPAVATVAGKVDQNLDENRSIAIIGIAGRFPSAPTIHDLWRVLREGRNCVGPASEIRASQLTPASQPATIDARAGGYLDSIAEFDPLFFGISGSEARLMDPQQRLFLETAWEVIESAGYQPQDFANILTGVFVGVSNLEYLRHLERAGISQAAPLATGNTSSMVANRVSYALNLRGPSLSIDTACSSSLLAVHLACRSLRAGECSVAIAGGVSLIVSEDHTASLAEAGMLSPSGRCHTFDDRADGYVRGEGVAAILLKPLAQAKLDGDPIWGVIEGSATNHDGHAKIGFTAPSPRAQVELLRSAYRDAGIEPKEIQYLEAHGTGTSLGDPIEVAALTETFTAAGVRAGTCALGSVKSNLGHLEAAAGITGLIKIVLALYHREMPPIAALETPNRHIDFASTPFFVNDRLQPWKPSQPRRAAVSSFGAGGANVHVIAREFADTVGEPYVSPPKGPAILTLSARTEIALRRLIDKYLDYLNEPDAEPLYAVCESANRGRAPFEYRLAIIARHRDQLCDRLRLLRHWEDRDSLQGSLVFVGSTQMQSLSGIQAIQRRLERLTDTQRNTLTRSCHGDWFESTIGPTIRSLAGKGSIARNVSDDPEAEYLACLAELFCNGATIDWTDLYGRSQIRRILLPTYPFERERYWVDLPDQTVLGSVAAPTAVLHLPATNDSSPDLLSERIADDGRESVRGLVLRLLSQRLGLPEDRLPLDRPFFEMGLESILATQLAAELSDTTKVALPATLFLDYPTLNQLVDALVDKYRVTAVAEVERTARHALRPAGRTVSTFRSRSNAIAIIGMGGRFPGAENLEELWKRLAAGYDAVGEVPSTRWSTSRYYASDRKDASKVYSRWGAFLDHIELFDPGFFHISPREVIAMDPQQRILLEVAWETLESAGYAGGQVTGSKTGVYIGAMASEYLSHLFADVRHLDIHAATGNVSSIIANRLSHLLNLKGPCLSIDTACSSSLVAVHLAVESLRRGECDLALAGGTQAGLGLSHYRLLSRLGALSPTGRCRTFDRHADGYVLGEGVGLLFLKPLSAAIEDGDDIRGVILGTAVNHSGMSAGLTVPNSHAQAEVIRTALADAGVSPESIGYLEAHGTGTSLGDPIEMDGLTEAFRSSTARRQYCAIGSVKSNIGHLEPAAGVAGIIKAVLAMEGKLLPPTLHVDEPNPKISFQSSPFYLVDRLRPWLTETGIRRAGVSSFGFGGTNAHVVLEQAPSTNATAPSTSEQLIALSARSERSLLVFASRIADWLLAHPESNLANIAYTLANGRAALEHRVAILATSAPEAAHHLRDFLDGHQSPFIVTRNSALVTSMSQKVNPHRSLALRYVEGESIPWTTVFPEKHRKIRLPTSFFERSRYWVGPPAEDIEPSPVSTDHPIHRSQLARECLYEVVWTAAEIPAFLLKERALWLLTGVESELSSKLLNALTAEGHTVFRYPWTEDANGPDRLNLQTVVCDQQYPISAVHVLSSSDGQSLEGAILSLRSLILNISTHAPRGSRIFLVTDAVASHSGATAEMDPRSAALWGLCRVLRLEYPNIDLRTIHVAAGGVSDARLILRYITQSGPREILLRHQGAFTPTLSPITVDSSSGPLIRDHGVYVVTGGLGPLGLEIARYLTSKGTVHIVLLGRSPATGQQLDNMRALESAGSKIESLCCDLRDLQQTSESFAAIRKERGPIRGVVHAAGVLRDSLIGGLTREVLEAVLQPKRLGLQNLLAVTTEDSLDFLVNFSSLAALVGNIGQGAYAAANATLHPIIASAQRRSFFTTIYWGPWSTGMAASAEDRMRSMGLKSIDPDLGRDLLDLALASGRNEIAAFRLDESIRSQIHRLLPLADFHQLTQLVVTSLPDAKVVDTPHNDQRVTTARRLVKDVIAEVLRLSPGEIDLDSPFQDLGVDSMLAEEIVRRLSDQLSVPGLSVAMLFEHPTAESLAKRLAGDFVLPSKETVESPTRVTTDQPAAFVALPTQRAHDIAIVGYACRFPRANNAVEFWEILRQGRDVTESMEDARWDLLKQMQPEIEATADARRPVGGFLSDIDQFDPFFFRMSPTEANQTDPRQRLFLETAYEAAESAGYGGRRLAGTKSGVFVGCGANDYYSHIPLQNVGSHAATGGTAALGASRLSYFLNLHGPALPVDTACSSSLVAIHLAVQSLRSGHCDFAFAGGVHLHLNLTPIWALERMGALSSSGHCRPFDAEADGFVPAEGVGVVLLRRLEDARADGDTIVGVIKGSAINNDGHSNGLTAPNPAAQRELLKEAWNDAAISPSTLSYVEMHGTGTPLGDPIEAASLTAAFAAAELKPHLCNIGSVKGNIGHADAAAGMAGLIKVLLSFRHHTIPASIHCPALNPRIAFDGSPLSLATQTAPWTSTTLPRRAGISAFGFNGTNAHIVVEEPPTDEIPASDSSTPQLFLLSAATPDTLTTLARAYHDFLDQHCHANLVDICFTVGIGRLHLRHRLAILCTSTTDLRNKLSRFVIDPMDADNATIHLGDAAQAIDEATAADLSSLSPNAAALLQQCCHGARFEEEIRPLLQIPAEPKTGDTAGFPSVAEVRHRLLATLATLYVLGVDIQETRLYGHHPRSIPLPTYPYARQRCWWNCESSQSPAPSATRVLTTSRAIPIRAMQWVERKNEASVPLSRATIWVLAGTSESEHRCIDNLRPFVRRLIHLEPGSELTKLSTDHFRIRLSESIDVVRLFEDKSLQPDIVVHLLSIASPSVQSRESTAPLEGLLALAQGLGKLRHPIRLRIVTRGSHAVSAFDCHAPEQALLWGFARVLPMEMALLDVSLLDLPFDADDFNCALDDFHRDLLVDSLPKEIAYRSGKSWVPRVIDVPKASRPETEPTIRRGGVYLITGGTGGIGLALAKWLTDRYDARIALVGRRPWEELAPAQRTIVEQIRAEGKSILTFAADVGNYATMRTVIHSIRDQFGEIHGVFHAAGHVQKRSIAQLTPAEMAATLHPKVQGCWILDRLFADRPLDFLVLFSSVAGLQGNVFEADYSAANRFLDSFAAWRSAQGKRTLAIDWGTWSVGMGAPLANSATERRLRYLTTEDALEALERALTNSLPQLIIDPGYEETVETSVKTTYSAGDMEEWVVRVVADLLQATPEQLDRHASFVDLGFDSILAVQLARRLESELDIELHPTLPFDHPSIERLAAYLAARRHPPTASPSIPSSDPTNGHSPKPAMQLASGRKLLMVKRRYEQRP